MSRNALTRSQAVAKARELHLSGQFAPAMRMYRELVKTDPQNPHLLYALGQTERFCNEFEEARRSLEKSLRLRADAPDVLCELAVVQMHLGDFDEAERLARKAESLKPGYFLPLHTRADILRLRGDTRAALELIEPLVQNADCRFMVIHLYTKLAPKADKRNEAIALLERVLASGTLTPNDSAHALFRLGDLLNDAERYDDAFWCYQQANRIRYKPFDPAVWRLQADSLISFWSRQRLERLPQARSHSELPVFIVGMPRSGSTLVEQIIESHPQAAAGGERMHMMHLTNALVTPRQAGFEADAAEKRLTSQALGKASWEYERELKKVASGALRITDKLPDNFFRLGFIDRILPNARVIWCRRDPMDTCLSCYFHDFMGSHPYAGDLTQLGVYYREHERVMEHWIDVLDLPILTVEYESLVEHQRAESQRLIEFCGLEWDEACLRFFESSRVAMTASHEQVRQPIYRTAIGRHRKYAAHLEALRRSLGVESAAADAPAADDRHEEAAR